MQYSVSEIARKLDVHRDLVKTWAFRFKDYLSAGANPPRETQRQFNLDDLRVLAYVCDYWDEDPDIESITIGLNMGEHDNERYDALLDDERIIFQDPPDYLNEDCRHGSLMGGMIEGLANNFTIAESYRLAGDVLVRSINRGPDGHEIARPVLFCYRHALELYLKATATKDKPAKGSGKSGHALADMLEKLDAKLKKEHSSALPKWFRDTVLAFDEFDQYSTTFRYADGLISRKTNEGGEFWIDFLFVQNRLSQISEAVKVIRRAFKIEDDAY